MVSLHMWFPLVSASGALLPLECGSPLAQACLGNVPKMGPSLLQVQIKDLAVAASPTLGSFQIGVRQIEVEGLALENASNAHMLCTASERHAAAAAIALLLSGPSGVAWNDLAGTAASRNGTAANRNTSASWVGGSNSTAAGAGNRLLTSSSPAWNGDPCILGITKFAWAAVLTGLAMIVILICIPFLLTISRRRPPGQSAFPCLDRTPPSKSPPWPPEGMAVQYIGAREAEASGRWQRRD